MRPPKGYIAALNDTKVKLPPFRPPFEPSGWGDGFLWWNGYSIHSRLVSGGIGWTYLAPLEDLVSIYGRLFFLHFKRSDASALSAPRSEWNADLDTNE